MKNLFLPAFGLKDKKIVILGSGKHSLLLFTILLQNNIYVSAFLVNEKIASSGMRIMNKPVISMEDAEKEKERIILVAAGENVLKEAEELEKKGFIVYFDFNFAAYEGDSIFLQADSEAVHQ